MSPSGPNRRWVIALTIILGIGFNILPLPAWAEPFRPDWVALVMIYWCMALPNRVGVASGWFVGLLLDVVEGVLLGQHAFAYAVLTYLTVRLAQRIRVFPLRQQALTVLLFLILHQLLLLWIMGLAGNAPDTTVYFVPSLLGTLLWPWIFTLLRDTRRRFEVR